MQPKVTPIEPFGVLVEPHTPKVHVTELNTESLRQLFQQNHLIVLRGFETFKNSEEFATYCELWGEISLWPFGKVLELIQQEKPEDHIFDSGYVPLHWDGMYRPQVPEYQIFHCVQAPLQDQGGRTTFSNTVLALKHAPAELKDLWSQVTGIYKRKMEFYDSTTVSPLVTTHPHRGFPVIRYNEPPSNDQGHFVNPPDLEFRGLTSDQIEAFHQVLKSSLYSPTCFYAHQWQAGDIVIADNFTLLHGREKFVSRAPRHIQRVHVLSNPPFDNPGLESYQ